MSFVYAASLTALAKLSDALNVPFEELAHRSGIDIGLLNLPDATVPAEKFLRLHEEVLQQTGNEDFGLLCGRINFIESFHLYMSLAAASNTFREWINLIPQMTPTMGNMLQIVAKRKGDYLVLEMRFDGALRDKRCAISDTLLATTVMLMDGFCVLPVRPVRVDFAYPEPRDTKALKEVFRAPLHFKQPVTAVYYDINILDLPQLHVSTSLYDNVEEELDEFLTHFSWRADAFTTNLYSVVRRQLATGDCTVSSVAKRLNISSRTLQLRLQERDTQFRYFLRQLRSTLALKYLQDESFSILNIALLLGYSDPASFSTAFKSWHGCSPSEYRRHGL